MTSSLRFLAVLLVIITTAPAPAATVPLHRVVSCNSARSEALANVSDALTGGSDSAVLRAAIAERSRLQTCGFTRDAESLALIAADAYGDVNEPKQRCLMLHAAHGSAASRGDAQRAGLIEHALGRC